MIKCSQCGSLFASSKKIDGVKKNLSNRRKCLTCSPFKSVEEKKSTQKSEEQKKKDACNKTKKWTVSQKEITGVEPTNERRRARKAFIIRSVGGKCQNCGYFKLFNNLVFHHLFDKKRDLTTESFGLKLENLFEEINKCVLVCHNCHGEIHSGLIGQDDVNRFHDLFKTSIHFMTGKTWQDFLVKDPETLLTVCKLLLGRSVVEHAAVNRASKDIRGSNPFLAANQ